MHLVAAATAFLALPPSFFSPTTEVQFERKMFESNTIMKQID
jgi:hypothetical protein